MVVNVDTAPAVAESRRGDFALRVVSALVMAPVAAVAILRGGAYFDALIALGGAVLAWEWDRLCGGGRFRNSGWVLLATVLGSVVAASLRGMAGAFLVLALGSCLVYGAATIAKLPNRFWRVGGVAYIGVPAVSLIWLRLNWGPDIVMWLFLVVWATDIGAYVVGRLVGGPRLAPMLSPNKTWAGFAGGLAAASAAGALFARGFTVSSPGIVAALCLPVSLVSQGGDLLESAIKRHFKVKDASTLIPGHGGLLDRVDSLLAAAPFVALMQLASGGEVLAWR
jgi:phosphatidate cytidylyltransferase